MHEEENFNYYRIENGSMQQSEKKCIKDLFFDSQKNSIMKAIQYQQFITPQKKNLGFQKYNLSQSPGFANCGKLALEQP